MKYEAFQTESVSKEILLELTDNAASRWNLRAHEILVRVVSIGFPEAVRGSQDLLLCMKSYPSIVSRLISRKFQFGVQKPFHVALLVTANDFTLDCLDEECVNFAAGQLSTTPGTTVVFLQ